MKKLLGILVVLSLLTMALVACGGGSGNSNSGSGNSGSGNEVHMGDTNFTQSSVTIKKGDSLNLVDDSGAVHIIANGTWDGTSPKPMTESGAPTVNNLQFNGNDSHTVGPFNTAGTFHLYCTVHPGMSLTVTVQ